MGWFSGIKSGLKWFVGADKDSIIKQGFDAIRKGADELHYSGEEKAENAAQQDIRDKAHEVSMEQEITKRWTSDNSAPITRLVRPLSYFFVLIVTFIFGALDASLSGFSVSSEWLSLYTQLLITMTIAYFGMRGLEKIRAKKA